MLIIPPPPPIVSMKFEDEISLSRLKLKPVPFILRLLNYYKRLSIDYIGADEARNAYNAFCGEINKHRKVLY
jgi:hypothetical protein